MDLIREHLMYKNTDLNICMKNLTPQEHYEVIRIILGSQNKNIFICRHNVTNKYVNTILDKMNITAKDCSVVEESLKTFQ